MKTIKIKVTIDGVNYFSKKVELSDDHIQETADEIESAMEENGHINFENEEGLQMFFGSDLVKKSIITIIDN